MHGVDGMQRKMMEQDLTHSSFMMLPLTIFILFLAYNYQKVCRSVQFCHREIDDNFAALQTVVSRTCSSLGDRTFAAAGPQVWNSLPSNLRLCELSYG